MSLINYNQTNFSASIFMVGNEELGDFGMHKTGQKMHLSKVNLVILAWTIQVKKCTNKIEKMKNEEKGQTKIKWLEVV